MRSHTWTTAFMLGACVIQAVPALAQTPSLSDAQCQTLRQRLAGHARLSEGVRRAVAAQTGATPTAPAAAVPSPPPTGRAETIRARLAQIPTERRGLEDQRLGATMKFEISRAAQIQMQMQALDTEKASLERELAALPASSSASPHIAAPATPAADPALSLGCQDVSATLDSALKIRRRELGARDEQTGAIPLVALKGQTPGQIGQEFAEQFPAGATPGSHIGLLDSDGDKQIDGFVDMPAAGTYRLIRQRTDGTIAIDAFPAPGAAGTAAYGEMMRRLDESTARQGGLALADLLAVRPASAPRITMQTADFATAHAPFQAGDFAEAARLATASARSVEFQNMRGQTVRVLEILGPVANGVSLRRVVVLAQPNDQELWEESTAVVRPTYLRTDVEVTRSRETHTTSGALVGSPSASKPTTFTLER